MTDMPKNKGGAHPSDRAGAATRLSPAVSSKAAHPLRKKSGHKPRDHFIKRRKHAVSLKQGTGGINACWRPSNEASKADLAEYHAEEMKLRRRRQRNRQPGFTEVDRKVDR